MNKISHAYSSFLLTVVCLACAAYPAHAATPSTRFSFSTIASVDSVSAITSSGTVFAGKRKGAKIDVSVPTSSLRDTSFFASFQGKQIGPLLEVKGNKAYLVLNKSITDKKTKKVLKAVSLKLSSVASNGSYVTLKTAPDGVFNRKYSYAPSSFSVLGLNSSSTSRIRAVKKAPGDSDGDGVVDSLDVDKDGDGINDIADADTVLVPVKSKGLTVQAEDGADSPFTSMYLALNNTINWHITGGLTRSQIDATVGGENIFAMAFYTNLSGPEATGVSGGHLICSESIEYCRPSGGTAVYSGFSDGDSSLAGRLWSGITTDGSPYSLERMNNGGGGDGEAITLAGSFQPRVGTDRFFPGQNFRLDFTNSSRSVVLSKNFTLPLFFTTVPALKSFGVSTDSSGDSNLDYASASIPGTFGNPIVLASSGDFAGKLRVKAWRLQRQAVTPLETGSEYRDYGHLNYGVLINNSNGEFTCGGLYSNLSSTLTESPSAGANGGFSSRDGALLWPLVDSASDYEPSNAAALESANTIQFTVDLKSCLTRNGLSAGTHTVTLIAAGASFRNGANRAGQMFSVTVP